MLVRLLKERFRPYTGQVTAIVALQLAATIASLYLPTLNADIIDDGVAKGDTGAIMRLGGLMLAVSMVQIVASVGAVFLAARISMGIGRDLRAGVFHQVGEFSTQEVSRFGAPTLISRSTNDVTQVQMIMFMGLAMMITAPITMVGGIIMALRQDVGLSWLLVVAVPLLGVSVGLVVVRMVPQFEAMQTGLDSVNRIMREQITGIRVVRAFVREDVERDRFAEANASLTRAGLNAGRLMSIIFPIVMLIMNLSTVAVLWFGGKRVADNDMEIGALVAFMSYLMQILISVMMAAFMSTMIPRASVSSRRIMEVLDTASTVAEPANPRTDFASPAAVVFDNVGFSYPGAAAPVLHDLTFTALPGRTTAIIGSTGAGKTTLVNLVPRLFDITSGRLTLGGVPIADADLDSLWARIGLVPQKPYLFTGTVASNLRYGNPEATDEQLWDALRIAQAADFVAQMSEGLDSPIAQGGTNVSGGQRQRLAIARALVRQPEVYLFDDAFSALDVATDARLRAALKPVTRDATVIVVAQRVSTVIDADQIIVLDDGRIVGIGTHDELLTTCTTYQEIVTSQRAAQEAA